MRKSIHIALILLLLISFTIISVFATATNTTQLVILHTNDTHGHPLKFTDAAPGEGGLPARATMVSRIRSTYANVLLLDAGDLNTGRPESNFFKAEPDIKGYNYLGYDALALGNHEFDNPLAVLKTQMSTAKFPFLAANVKTADGKYLAQPYIIKDFKSFKVAIFGLTTRETETVGSPENIKGLVFEDEVEAAKKLLPELRKKADIIVALVHMGIYSDDEHGSRRLAKYVSGINLIVDGHTHTRLSEPVYVNGAPIVQAWQWGLQVGKAVMTIDRNRVVGFQWEPLPVNLKNANKKADETKEVAWFRSGLKEDPKLLAVLQPYYNQVEKVLAKVIGKAIGTFPNRDTRIRETALGDLVADAIQWSTRDLKPDFTILNSGSIRADLPEGPITEKLIYGILPFDNSITVVTMKGTEVIALFDYIATIPQGKGGFPQVSQGVRFTLNYTTGKCENILIHGNPIDPGKRYRIVTNSYMAAGGDGYQVFLNAAVRYDTSVFVRDAVIEYILNFGGIVKPEINGRIRIIGNKTVRIREWNYDLFAA
jgi:5'-nucleotidase/UDP-sugar diphosphatase